LAIGEKRVASVVRPLHCDFARGKFAGSLVFCDGLFRQYASVTGPRRKVCTERQRYIRDMIKEAWARWKTLSPEVQAPWNTGRDRRFYARKERKWHVPQKGVYLYVATYMHYHLYQVYDKNTKTWVWKEWTDSYTNWHHGVDP